MGRASYWCENTIEETTTLRFASIVGHVRFLFYFRRWPRENAEGEARKKDRARIEARFAEFERRFQSAFDDHHLMLQGAVDDARLRQQLSALRRSKERARKRLHRAYSILWEHGYYDIAFNGKTYARACEASPREYAVVTREF